MLTVFFQAGGGDMTVLCPEQPIIEPTVEAFAELAPALLAPAHCTGWKAQYRLAMRFPDAFVMSTVGTTITI